MASAAVVAIAASHGCGGGSPGSAPGAGAAGRAGFAGKGGTLLAGGGTAGSDTGRTGSGGVLATGAAGGGGGDANPLGMNGTGGSAGETGGIGGSPSGGVGGLAPGGVGGSPSSTAIANVMPMNPGTTTGTATFVATSNGVRVTVKLTNCPEGRHPLHIHAGDACTNATTQGGHWGPTRGENIGPNGGEISCDASLRGTLTYTRLNPDPVTRWTVGDGTMSDVVGHPLVIQGLDGTGREGCGVIQLAKGDQGGSSGSAGASGAGGRAGAAGASGSAGSHGGGGSSAASGGSQGTGGAQSSSGGSQGTGGAQSSGGAPGSGGASAGSGGSFGAGGSGPAGGNHGSAGSMGSAGAAGTAGAGGTAPRTAAAVMMPFDAGTISGTVTFVEVPNGVKVTYDVMNCPEGQHPTQIHAGTGCGSTAAQGDVWDRGLNIGPSGGEISCDDTQRGTLTYVRTNEQPEVSWTIGDGSASDIVGHPLIIRALNAVDRDACGVIARAGAGGGSGSP